MTLLAVYVITVKTPEGELVIHSDTAGITVKIKSDGEEVVTGWKIVKGDDNKQLIRIGQIEIELPANLAGEFNVTPNTVTLTKGKQEIVKIERKEPSRPTNKPTAKPPVPHFPLANDTTNVTGPALDRRAAEWVIAHGGTCFIHDFELGKSVWLKPGDSLPSGPIALNVVQGSESMKNEDLKNLAGLQNVARLRLVSPSIDNGAIPHVARLKRLLEVCFWQTSVRTSALAAVGWPPSADLPSHSKPLDEIQLHSRGENPK